ncbi:MAG: D-alanyl-D-alanine carboxypeptidase/D-alanyl-D-alanine-endopeptidase [Acidobacteria bacterium]|nr:D-alanyl-D-alanine carboxypeptidase/D-alanyl-D-alanine-endopeptidase [Acidobacteriota bacterium]
MPAVTRLRLAGSVAAIALLLTGCVVRRPPATVALPGASNLPAGAVPESAADVGADTPLGSTLDAIFNDPDLGPVVWSAEMRVLRGQVLRLPDETLYARNQHLLLTPASTMKVVTVAAAAERLGWNHRFETTLAATGEIRDGTLEGDLVVRGTGDPTINAPGTEDLLARWAGELRARGIVRIAGRIIGDDDAFDGGRRGEETAGLGAGWAWDDLALAFSAPAGALQQHENVVELAVSPADSPGSPARIEIRAPRVAPGSASGVTLINQTVTRPEGGNTNIRLSRRPDGGALLVTGEIPLGAPAAVRTGAVSDPTLFFVQGLRTALQRAGVDVEGEAIDIDQFDPAVKQTLRQRLRPLIRHESEPLSTIAVQLMKRSQNLYAESLLQHLGVVTGGTGDTGPAAAGAVLDEWGIGGSRAIIADGSGLSRYNALSAAGLLDVLARLWRDPRHREPFVDTLPVAGRDGTLRNRMVGSAADGAVRAKTGSMTRVRALAGYVVAQGREPIAFAILANNYTVPSAEITRAIDAAVVAIAAHAQP